MGAVLRKVCQSSWRGAGELVSGRLQGGETQLWWMDNLSSVGHRLWPTSSHHNFLWILTLSYAGRETLISRVGETQLWWMDNHLFWGQLLLIATLNLEYLHFRRSVLLQEYSCKCNTDNTQATQTKQQVEPLVGNLF